jgi:hypothetical protein
MYFSGREYEIFLVDVQKDVLQGLEFPPSYRYRRAQITIHDKHST